MINLPTYRPVSRAMRGIVPVGCSVGCGCQRVSGTGSIFSIVGDLFKAVLPSAISGGLGLLGTKIQVNAQKKTAIEIAKQQGELATQQAQQDYQVWCVQSGGLWNPSTKNCDMSGGIGNPALGANSGMTQGNNGPLYAGLAVAAVALLLLNQRNRR